MRKTNLLIWVLLLITAMSANLSAYSGDDLTFIGFSADGKYLAFEVFTPSSEAGDDDTWKSYIVETDKNSFAVPPVVVISDSDHPAKSEAAYRRYKQKLVPEILRQFGIVRRNTGRLVVSHLFNEWSEPAAAEKKQVLPANDDPLQAASDQGHPDQTKKERVISFEKITFRRNSGNRQNKSKSYELTLKTTAARVGEVETGNAKLELTLRDKTRSRIIGPQVLQKDGNVMPKSRDWALDYKIESVYLYKDKIAVFINVFGYGYEEISMSYLVVTGTISK